MTIGKYMLNSFSSLHAELNENFFPSEDSHLNHLLSQVRNKNHTITIGWSKKIRCSAKLIGKRSLTKRTQYETKHPQWRYSIRKGKNKKENVA
jgi:hypothetical protein